MNRFWTSLSRQRKAIATSLAIAATAVPLALCVDTHEMIRATTVLAGSGQTITIEQPVAISPHLPLTLESGQLYSDVTTNNTSDALAKLLLDRGVFRLSFDHQMNRRLEQPNQPIQQQLSELNISLLTVKNSTFEIVLEGRSVLLADVSAEIRMFRKTQFTARGTATLHGQQIHFVASWGTPTDSRSKSEGSRPVAPLKVTVRSNLLEAVIEGRIFTGGDLRLVGNAEFRASRLRTLARWLGIPIPVASDLRDASIVGPLDWNAGRLIFTQAAIAVDGNQGKGALTIKLTGNRPSVEGTLGFDRFSLEPHLTAFLAKPDSKAESYNKEHRSIAAAIDADLRLSASKVSARDFELGRGAATISIKHGRLSADLAELGVEGGQAVGQITFDATDPKPRMSLKAKLTGVDPGRVFTGWMKRNPLLGRGDFTFDGTGTGEHLAEILAKLSGKGHFRLTEPGRLGLDLHALHYAAKSANHVGWSAAGKGGTALDQLEARISISNGAVTIEQMQGRSGATILTGKGKIDIESEILDLTIALGPERAKLHGPPRSALGAAVNSTNPQVESEPSDVLVLRGSWADPAIGVLGRPFTTTAPIPTEKQPKSRSP